MAQDTQVIDDPVKAALAEIEQEEGEAKKAEEEINREDTPKTETPAEEKETDAPEKDTVEAEAEKQKKVETSKKELAKKAAELGLPETATKEEIESVELSRKEAEETAKAEKKAKFKLKEDATDEEIKAAETKAQQEAEEAEIAEYAQAHNLTPEKAKTEIAEVKGIVTKYEKDPVKIAKAYKAQQAEYSRLKAEYDTVKATPPKVVTLTADEIQIGSNVFKKEKIIAAYTQKYPEETADMTDDQILFSAKKEFEVEIKKAQSELSEKNRIAAEGRKKELVSSLGAQDKKFEKEVREMLDNTGIEVILNDKDGRLAQDYARYIKGEKYEEREKQFSEELRIAKEKAFKAGQESIRIKSGPVGSGAAFSGKRTVALNATEKRRAIEMYGNAVSTDEEAYQLFSEVGLDEYRKEQK